MNINNYINNKSLQKKMSKIPQSMIDKLTQSMETNKVDDNLSLSDKLRLKINKSKMSRLPKDTRDDLNQKQETKENEENSKKVESEKNQKKNNKNKLKKLNKKYGIISDEQYYISLEYLKNNTSDKIQTDATVNDTLHHKNIIDLYNYQHANESEMIIDESTFMDD